MPVPFCNRLLDRGITLVEVLHDEFDSTGTNVLALAPRRCVIVAGNPKTRERLERAGAQVFEYEGQEISLNGGGGPTCLTRPLARGG
jgi:N-dimethylarginine dimethylaminohydrolase